MAQAAFEDKLPWRPILAFSAFLFSLFTVFIQVPRLSLAYLPNDQLNRHLRIIEGAAPSPYQYRVLSEYVVEAVIQVYMALNVTQPVISGFISFRVVQNLVIFLLVLLYYKKLGLDSYVTLVGMSLLAWAMTHSLYESDLNFNTYSDVIFYLAAALAILHGRSSWIIPIVGIAAINRETSGLIPLLLIAHSWVVNSQMTARMRDFKVAAGAMALYVLIFFALRLVYGDRPLALPNGNYPGIELLKYNLFRYITWVQIFATLGVIPLLALVSLHRWPPSLRAFCWVLLPAWLVVHLFFAVLAETRLLLVPFVLVLLPGALFGLVKSQKAEALDHPTASTALSAGGTSPLA